jgi:hypothetical protein
MNLEPTITQLEALLETAGLLPANYADLVASPLTEWLDSLGRLQLVTLIEEAWDFDLEQELMGVAARRMTLGELAALVHDLGQAAGRTMGP